MAVSGYTLDIEGANDAGFTSIVGRVTVPVLAARPRKVPLRADATVHWGNKEKNTVGWKRQISVVADDMSVKSSANDFGDLEALEHILFDSQYLRIRRANTVLPRMTTTVISGTPTDHGYWKDTGNVGLLTDPTDGTEKPFYVVRKSYEVSSDDEHGAEKVTFTLVAVEPNI